MEDEIGLKVARKTDCDNEQLSIKRGEQSIESRDNPDKRSIFVSVPFIGQLFSIYGSWCCASSTIAISNSL